MSTIKEFEIPRHSTKTTLDLDYDGERLNEDSEISTSRFKDNLPAPVKPRVNITIEQKFPKKDGNRNEKKASVQTHEARPYEDRKYQPILQQSKSLSPE